MARSKRRAPVVLDTNVFARNFKSRNLKSPNRRVVWIQAGRLDLILSPGVVSEYLDAFARVVEMDDDRLEYWRERLGSGRRCRTVNLGRQFDVSRDPDDNIFLATALAGRAEFLITNDRDLLELPEAFRVAQPFIILTPKQFLAEIEAS